VARCVRRRAGAARTDGGSMTATAKHRDARLGRAG
jgi:hypothetical protein